MSIQFKTVRYKNFLAAGDKFIELQLNRFATTLIVGKNGNGKSSLTDSIFFALFGKPYRNINKKQLVNTINDRDCLVELEFSIGPIEYKIVRGIKPNIFEIYQDGKLIDQESHRRDYQEFLEDTILRLNPITFRQITVLGSAVFTPFMQLSPGERRKVIEDILGIDIFTRMNILLKERVAKHREDLSSIAHQLSLLSERVEASKKYIAGLKKLGAEQQVKTQEQISKLEDQAEKLSLRNTQLNETIGDNQKKLQARIDKLTSTKGKLATYSSMINEKITLATSNSAFYRDNQTCPTCMQIISDALRKEKTDTAERSIVELKKGKTDITEQIASTQLQLNDLSSELSKISLVNTQIHSNNQLINNLQRQIAVLEKTNTPASTSEISLAETQLLAQEQEVGMQVSRRQSMQEESMYHTAMLEMLKDTGIKTKIVSQYLPVINKLINRYLQELDFFVSFALDENFVESIKSRFRDIFTYASFSEGEKARINLAILFTWREIARMKHSASTNLLILDEVSDAALDTAGVDSLLKILAKLESTNVLIISHREDALAGKFESTIVFSKEKNFSEMKLLA